MKTTTNEARIALTLAKMVRLADAKRIDEAEKLYAKARRMGATDAQVAAAWDTSCGW